MILRCSWRCASLTLCILLTATASLQAQAPAQPPSAKTAPKTTATKMTATRSTASPLDPGSVTNGVYSNKALGLTCKIPEGWVLRTDELNGRQEEKKHEDQKQEGEKENPAQPNASSAGAKAQGFTQDEDPYDIAIGNKKLVRGDFHKDVGTRVMRQSTLAILIHGYAISITVIAGTDDDVEDLIDGIGFGAGAK